MTTRKPEFITFTGADCMADVPAMRELAAEYPIEWAILFSASRQALSARYPSMDFIGRLINHEHSLVLAAHLCGEWCDKLIADSRDSRLYWLLRTARLRFGRIQINTAKPRLPVAELEDWCTDRGAQLVLQCRDRHPQDQRAQWLFDQSGGSGAAPAAWPAPLEEGRIVGYAGGISPDNVRDVIAAIPDPSPYWLDMESGIRTNDKFDVQKCRAVCEAIWGATTDC